MKVKNDSKHLRRLLTDLYVAVLGRLPTDDAAQDEMPPIPLDKWDGLMTSVLDAAEGRDFEPLELPWP